VPNTAPKWVSQAKNLWDMRTRQFPSSFGLPWAHGGLDALKATVADVSKPAECLLPAKSHLRRAVPRSVGPDPASLAQVKTWLADNGLSTTGVEATSRYVDVSGTVAAAQKAFGW